MPGVAAPIATRALLLTTNWSGADAPAAVKRSNWVVRVSVSLPAAPALEPTATRPCASTASDGAAPSATNSAGPSVAPPVAF